MCDVGEMGVLQPRPTGVVRDDRQAAVIIPAVMLVSNSLNTRLVLNFLYVALVFFLMNSWLSRNESFVLLNAILNVIRKLFMSDVKSLQSLWVRRWGLLTDRSRHCRQVDIPHQELGHRDIGDRGSDTDGGPYSVM